MKKLTGLSLAIIVSLVIPFDAFAQGLPDSSTSVDSAGVNAGGSDSLGESVRQMKRGRKAGRKRGERGNRGGGKAGGHHFNVLGQIPDLSDKQKQQIEEIQNEFRQKGQSMRQELKALRQTNPQGGGFGRKRNRGAQVQSEASGEGGGLGGALPPGGAGGESFARFQELRGQMKEMRNEFQARVEGVLSPAQVAQYNELTRQQKEERKGRMQRFRERRQGGAPMGSPLGSPIGSPNGIPQIPSAPDAG